MMNLSHQNDINKIMQLCLTVFCNFIEYITKMKPALGSRQNPEHKIKPTT